MGIWRWLLRLFGVRAKKPKRVPSRTNQPALPPEVLASLDSAAKGTPSIRAKAVFAGDIAQSLTSKIRGLIRVATGPSDRQLLSLLLRAVKNDGAELPAMPKEFLAIQRLLSNADVQLSELANAIQREPSIAAKFLAVANSPFYAARHRISDVRQAIVRLGLGTTQMLMTAILARSKVFRAPQHEDAVNRLYTHALTSAAIAQMLARLDNSSEEDAFVAGLFHQLGCVFILTSCGTVDGQTKSKTERVDLGLLESTQKLLNPGFSAMIVESWGYSQEVTAAIHHHVEPVPADGEDLVAFPEDHERLTFLLAAAGRLASSIRQPDSPGREAARQLLDALDIDLDDGLLADAEATANAFMSELGADIAA